MDQKWSWKEWKLRKQASKGLDSSCKGRQGSEKCSSKAVQEILGAEENDPKQELLEQIESEMRIWIIGWKGQTDLKADGYFYFFPVLREKCIIGKFKDFLPWFSLKK